MKLTITAILFLTFTLAFSQSSIDWSPSYELKLADFKSPQTEINEKLTTYSILTGAKIDFSFQMSNYEFMFTKNFNSKAKATFNKNAAFISAPDSVIANQLLKYGQYSFDLTELYTRKLRKELYEKKGTFSNVNFFQPIFNDLQNKMNAEMGRILKSSNFGKNEELLQQEHDKVISEIDALPDFCFDCKPRKKKKKKKRSL